MSHLSYLLKKGKCHVRATLYCSCLGDGSILANSSLGLSLCAGSSSICYPYHPKPCTTGLLSRLSLFCLCQISKDGLQIADPYFLSSRRSLHRRAIFTSSTARLRPVRARSSWLEMSSMISRKERLVLSPR